MVMVATAVGLAAGVLLAYILVAPVVRRLCGGRVRAELVQAAAVFGALLAAGPAFFLAIVIGGNFGGGWGDVMFGSSGVPVGIGVGLAIVFGVGLAFGACMLAIVVRAALHIVRRHDAL